ncbi:hypothetical protein Goari_009806 [Gossypium aridum]|uniref:Uncharacterized protein n=1 Tax=Gossypium aridum TaxID=34290 RepID=A0A7J8XY31_GOSAI|nr:hypothetical protein [Gossypium aridum]
MGQLVQSRSLDRYPGRFPVQLVRPAGGKVLNENQLVNCDDQYFLQMRSEGLSDLVLNVSTYWMKKQHYRWVLVFVLESTHRVKWLHRLFTKGLNDTDGDKVWLVLVDFEEIENSGDDGMTVVSLFNKMLCGGNYHL